MKIEEIEKIKSNVERAETIKKQLEGIDYALKQCPKWDNTNLKIGIANDGFSVSKEDFNILEILLNRCKCRLEKELEGL